jgi:hypothetical protein
LKKVAAIKKLCSGLLCNSEEHSHETKKHLIFSASLIENDITQEGCEDWFVRGSKEAALFVMEKVSKCSNKTLDDIYFLLLETSSSTVH